MNIAKLLSDDTRSQRIISDHFRSSIMLISDNVVPANTDRGYILRRLIRRAIFNTTKMNISVEYVNQIVDSVVNIYGNVYKNIAENSDKIKKILNDEIEKSIKALEQGIKEFEKLSQDKTNITGKQAFTLFTSYGLPIDLTNDLSKLKGITVDVMEFNKEFIKHQELSRKGAEQKFKGGLADSQDEMIIKYHTATHLLHQALHDVLGEQANQKGSNITKERLRFDFSHPTKMTDDEKIRVQDIVNEKISEALPVNNVILSREEADKTGARHFFGEKYGDQISIYYIGNDLNSAYSKEYCGGPHVKNTLELAGHEGKWKFKIQKEEAVAQGIRRIKAVLEN